jgi:ABC-type methionine transport system permease subunit
MMQKGGLEIFINAQDRVYETALNELKSGNLLASASCGCSRRSMISTVYRFANSSSQILKRLEIARSAFEFVGYIKTQFEFYFFMAQET